jgi:hypothetical protein
MKKLVILFLLTSLLTFSVFAIDGVGDFVGGLKLDMGDATDANTSRSLTIKPWLSFSRDIIENFNLYAEIAVPFTTPLEDIDFEGKIDEFDLKLTYGGIAAGPGSLGFFLNNKFVFPFKDTGDNWTYGFTFAATYGGIVAGPGALGFELGGDFPVYGGGDVDFVFDDIYLGVTYGLDLGVAITLKPFLLIDGEVEFGGLYAKVGYASDIFGAGVEIDKLGAGRGVDFGDDFPIDVYGEAYLLGGPLTVGAHIKFEHINGASGTDMAISPGLYVSYKF